MRSRYVTLPIISISLMIITSVLANNAYAQVEGTFQTEQDPTTGIKFSRPSEWGNIEKVPVLCNESTCAFTMTAGEKASISVIRGSSTDSLKDLVKSSYNVSKDETNFVFTNDNQTTVGKKYPAWQYEYFYSDYYGSKEKAHAVVSTYNGSYLLLKAQYPVELASKISPQFRKLIDSIELIPIQIPKPSFLETNNIPNTSTTENPKPLLNKSYSIKILSHNSYTDVLGFLHVVGEIQNDTPSSVQFVKVTGTFYDSNNQVVGTDFTYTNPNDIGSGQKAPFELILSSASIPITQIDHYNLVASYQ